MRQITGKLFSNTNPKIAIIVSRFNSLITSKLLEGCLDGLKRSNINENEIDVLYVPGAFEIPLVAKKLASTKKYEAIICLGCVIRGETGHYDFVCNEVSKGIASVMNEFMLPVIFGVLTTDNTDQALERAGVKSGNKGYESAVAAVEMINLMSNIEKL